MKKILYYISVAVIFALAATGCVRTDEKFDTLKSYLSTQTEVGIYRDGKAVYTFDKQNDQIYVDKAGLVFRIQNDDASKYIELTLSAEPTSGGSVDVVMDTTGYDGLVSSAFGSMNVTKLENNTCYLAGGSAASYTGLIIVWVK